MKTISRAKEILRRLKKRYKKAGPFAIWRNPLQLVVVTMLSAQCTDERVNMISGALFEKYPRAEDFARASVRDLEKAVYSTGYYRAKARYLKGIGKIITQEFGGKVPERFEDILKLPGISKKSACIIAAKAFKRYYGVAVDTHVFRVAPRLGLTKAKNRDKIAMDLEKLFPLKEYLNVNEFFITLGRDVCVPGTPKCYDCVLHDVCPVGKQVKRFERQAIKLEISH